MKKTLYHKAFVHFYEGKFAKAKPYFPPDSLLVRLGLFLSIYSVQRFFDNYVSDSRFLLDLGCGGGWKLLTKKAKHVVGVDISRVSLKTAQTLYEHVARADIRFLPFKSEFFNTVVSSDVLGHIPVAYKEKIISEIFRVSKKGGETFHLIEVDGEGILPSWCKKYPELHHKYIINLDGHYGLELPSIAKKRFMSSKFKCLVVKKIYSGFFWPITEYSKRFDNEFKSKSFFIRTLSVISRIVISNLYLHAVLDCFLGVVSRVWDALTPFEWADGLYIYAKK